MQSSPISYTGKAASCILIAGSAALTAATRLTILVLPALYAAWFRVKEPAPVEAPAMPQRRIGDLFPATG
jgi:hypothetical protein